MSNKKNWLGIFGIVLMISLMVIGCGGDNGEIYYHDSLNLSTATPPLDILTRLNLTLVEFNQIRDAAGGGFQGWGFGERGNFIMVWTGRNEANMSAVTSVILSLLDFPDLGMPRPIAEFHPTTQKILSGENFFVVRAGTLIAFLE